MPRFAQPEILLLASDEMCLSDVDVTRIRGIHGAVGRGIDQLSDRKRLSLFMQPHL